MEIVAGLLVLAGCGLVLNKQVSYGFPAFVTGVIEVVGIVSLLVEAFPTDKRFLSQCMNWRFRPNCGKGGWCVLLVHIAVLLSVFQHKLIFHQDFGPVILMAYSLSVLIISIPFQLIGVVLTDRTKQTTVFSVITFTALGLTYIMYAISIFFDKLAEVEIATVVGLALWTTIVQCLIQIFIPDSFSYGEATVVSHGIFFMFIFNHLLLYKVPMRSPVRPYTISASSDVTIFLQTAGASCLVIAFFMGVVPSMRNTLSFYSVLFGVAGAVATPILFLVFDKHFIVWMYEFVTASDIRIKLFGYWGLCSVVAALILYWTSIYLIRQTNSVYKAKDNDSSEESRINSDSYRQQGFNHEQEERFDETSREYIFRRRVVDGKYIKSNKNCSESKKKKEVPRNMTVFRKIFHIFAMFVFLPGLIYDRELLLVAATCAIIIFIILEVMRKVKVWPVGDSLDQYFRAFVDKRDSGPFILTHLYLLIGLTLPLWLYPYPLEEGIHPCLLSGFLSLGVGDTAASVIGSTIGMFRWPGTRKTLEGTLAAILFQIFALSAFDHADVMIGLDWPTALVAIVLTSLLEAFTTQIDNLILPLFMYILLIDPLRTTYT